MSLGEKILSLRKEKGLSQEALAEQVGATRQAISKWENDQDCPETEKLLRLSNIFGVSVDNLLKNEKQGTNAGEKGYYVSREMAAGYIAQEKRVSKYLGLGFSCWALGGIPWVLCQTSTGRLLGLAVCLVLGLAALVAGGFAEEENYRPLKEEPLLLDREHWKELSGEYRALRGKYRVLVFPAVILFVAGLAVLLLTARGCLAWAEYHAFVFLGFALGLLGVVYAAGVLEAYELLAQNEHHTASLFYKLKKKLKAKLDAL